MNSPFLNKFGDKNLLLTLALLCCGLLVFNIVSIVLTTIETYLPGPVQDSWGLMPYIENTLYSSHWFNAELLYPQNGHRYPFLKLSYLVDFYFFHASNFFLIFEAAVLILGTLLILLWIFTLSTVSSPGKWLIFLLPANFLVFPTLGWSFSHIFNLHMVQCAFFAYLSCALACYGLSNQSKIHFIAALVAAVACNFSTFTLTAIWPALFLLLWLNRAPYKYILGTALIFVSFSIIFLFVLPVDPNDSGKNYQNILDLMTEDVFHSEYNSSTYSARHWVNLLTFIPIYIINYLSLPKSLLGDMLSWLVTLSSIVWLIYHCWTRNRLQNNLAGNFSLAIMFFVICLSATTALARGFMADLSYGLRFHPFIALYWSCFSLHLLLFFKNKKDSYFFLTSATLFVWILATAIPNAWDMGKRLSGDYNRFAKAKTAYLSDNIHPNAVYENLVVAWRKNSYPGIVASLPFLNKHSLGIYHSSMARYAKESFKDNQEICLSLQVTQKSRARDPNIRNLIINAPKPSLVNKFPYIYIYQNEKLSGILFRKRKNPFSSSQYDTWIGLIREPLTQDPAHRLLARGRDDTSCSVDITSINNK